MKALSVRQPYAGLIYDCLKPFEIRSRPTNHRGDLLICVSKTAFPMLTIAPIEQIERYIKQMGKAICVVSLTDCRPMTPDDEKEAHYPFMPDLYVWKLENVRPIKPIDICGNLGLFNVKDEYITML